MPASLSCLREAASGGNRRHRDVFGVGLPEVDAEFLAVFDGLFDVEVAEGVALQTDLKAVVGVGFGASGEGGAGGQGAWRRRVDGGSVGGTRER